MQLYYSPKVKPAYFYIIQKLHFGQNQQILSQINLMQNEEQIAAAKKTIADCPQKKVKVLKKWL